MSSTDTPQSRIERACDRFGRPTVVERCCGLLAGGSEDPRFISMLGGAPALRLLDEGAPSGQEYWLRVWAARGLLWAGPGDNTFVLRKALADGSWRVREMVCKVIARHRLGDLLNEVAALEVDPVARVRIAAVRASRRIVEAEA
jgi:HEAT repeat protein